ncbi:MAG: glycosyltransferase family 4 protein [Candidatus Omnitrophica bacterium]|nr:glycosyltransferase family 4 protein [Candidatus Omnitrophota bacterium]
MKKIRVLHVIKTLSLGGAETNLLNLVAAMPGTHTHVAYSFGGEIESRFQKGGVRLYKYAQASHKIKSPATACIVYRLARYILKHDIQIVHTHVFNAHVWGALAAKLTGRKVVEHVHDFRYIDRQGRENGSLKISQYDYAIRMKNWSDGVILLTSQNRDFVLQNRLCPPERVWLIRNGIPLQPAPVETRPEEKVFLIPARISSEKNIHLLFQIAPHLQKECPQVRFLIAGEGPLLETYRQRVLKEGLESILQFIGFHPDIRSLLANAQAMILPSFLELHPVSILEALSLKKPVLVSKGVGCNSEVFTDGVDALLLDPHVPEEWTRAIVRLVHSPEWGRMIGGNGYELCRREFDIRNTAGQIQKVYQALLS